MARQTSKSIQKHKVFNLKISSLKEDKSNPNVMSSEKFEALKLSLKKYGNVRPITVDQNNIIADGHHRVKAFKELGIKTIEGYRKHFEDAEARALFRQAQNKIHGEHDPQKDYDEIEKLLDYNKEELYALVQADQNTLKELGTLIDSNKKTNLDIINESSERARDGNPTEHYADSFLQGNIKQITLYFDNDTYEKAISICDQLMDKYQVDNHTDLLWSILNYIVAQKIDSIPKMTVAPPQRQTVKYK